MHRNLNDPKRRDKTQVSNNMLITLTKRRRQIQKRLDEHQSSIPGTLRALKKVTNPVKISAVFFQWHQTWEQEKINVNQVYDFRFKMSLRNKGKLDFLLNAKLEELEVKRQNLHDSAKKYQNIFLNSTEECKFMGLSSKVIITQRRQLIYKHKMLK